MDPAKRIAEEPGGFLVDAAQHCVGPAPGNLYLSTDRSVPVEAAFAPLITDALGAYSRPRPALSDSITVEVAIRQT